MNSNFKTRIKMTILTIFLLLLASIAIFTLSIPFENNKTAAKLQKTLEETPLPEHTKLCDSVCAAGKLTGNGNGMQYFGGILIQSDLSLEELEHYYAKYRQTEWEYMIKPQTGTEIEPVEHGHMEFSYLQGKEAEDMEHYYIVYTWGSSKNIFADFDLCGH